MDIINCDKERNCENEEADKVYIACFDIGKKNFAFVVEEIDLSQLKSVKNIAYKDRYLKNGTPSSQFLSILRKVCKAGKIVLMENIDITYGTDCSLYLDPKIFINMNEVLDKRLKYWDKCSAFIVEQQMSFGKNKRNTMALKLGQHCYSYFTFHYADFKQTLEFPAYHKTKVLGAVKKLSKPERKKWAIEKAIEILTLREDDDNLSNLETRKKRDDISDCILMCVSFSYLAYIEKKL